MIVNALKCVLKASNLPVIIMSDEEKEVLELMQEEMQRYKAELLCPVCHRQPKDCILCKCQHIFCRECVDERISVSEQRERDV